MNKWIKKGNPYTVIDVIKCNSQGGAIAFVLEEIDLKGCEPYKGFNAERFTLVIEGTSTSIATMIHLVGDEELKIEEEIES